MSMITASAWVPRGAAARLPTKYEIDDAELSRISQLAKLQLEDAKNDLHFAQAESRGASKTDVSDEEVEHLQVQLPQSHGDVDNNLAEFNLEHYDSDVPGENGDAALKFGNAQALAYYNSNAEDPYITLQGAEDEEEREELEVLATDNMVVAARVEDEVAHLEVYIYEDEADNLYVHHDVMLPAIPLCVEWIDVPVGRSAVDSSLKGNYVAVGTFDPDIELWDLDTIDSMYPNAILGPGATDSKDDPGLGKKKKRKRSKKINEEYHIDAILSLAANRSHRNLLASSSADKTVKLWDLTTTKCARSYSYHTDKVCATAWNPRESTYLLSGSYDRTVVVADMRAPDTAAPRWGVESDVEAVNWNPHDPNFFYITTENGTVHYNDIRAAPQKPEASNPMWTLQAHDQSVSAFDVNPTIPGFLVTGSTDREIKLWNVQSTGPSMIVSRNLGLGKIFTTKFAPDAEVGFRLAAAGSKGSMQIWDTSTNSAVRRAFGSRVASSNEDVKERLVGVEEDSSDSEEGEEPGGNAADGAGGSMDED
ncbi:MAG: hypothetical protein Q9191_002011 [Dirinaria sp. TL-2023a]